MPGLELSLRCRAADESRLEATLEDLGALSVSPMDAADAANEQAILEPGVGETRLWPEVALLALFEDGTNEAVKNQTLGPHRAYISRINTSSIEVTELLPVNRGEWAMSRFFWPVTANVPVDPGKCPPAGMPLPSREAPTTAAPAAR
jgi:ribosomal protein L11 methylase PrmA